MALEAVGLGAGGSVLITGGAGALGGYCIQLARKAGLTVIAHGRPGDVETLRDLGSTHVISGEDPLPASVHAILPQGVDAVIDTARIGLPAAAAVRDDGVMVHVLPPSGDRDARLQQEVVSVTKRMGDKAALERLVELTKDGVLTPRVATVLSMTRAPQAHELVERGGLRGRVVLDFRPGSNLAD
jgi:NADPH:quinone reductase-like Zn-dependent oxidoreductase